MEPAGDIVLLRKTDPYLTDVFYGAAALNDGKIVFATHQRPMDQLCDEYYKENPNLVFVEVKGAGTASLMINANYIERVVPDNDNQNLETIFLTESISWLGQHWVDMLKVFKGSEEIKDLAIKECSKRSIPQEEQPQFVRKM